VTTRRALPRETHRWVCHWPILDDQLTLPELVAEAMPQISARMRAAQLAPVHGPAFRISEDGRELCCVVPARRSS
jgi:hypothetical protein